MMKLAKAAGLVVAAPFALVLALLALALMQFVPAGDLIPGAHD